MSTIFPYEIFRLIPDGTIFAAGKIANSPEGCYMTDNRLNDELRWVARKGYANDWCVYISWANESDNEFVAELGEKVINERYIRRMINADNRMLARYRY